MQKNKIKKIKKNQKNRTKLNIKNKLKDIFVFYQSKKRGEKKKEGKKKSIPEPHLMSSADTRPSVIKILVRGSQRHRRL